MCWRPRFWGIEADVSETLNLVRKLVVAERVRVSDHAYEEMLADDFILDEVLRGVATAVVVEDYPDAFKGPSVLVLQIHFGNPVHVVWGLPKIGLDFATLVTAYLPDTNKWYDSFMQRRPK
jgi:Domain of unknown function (DUF4258)